MNKQKLECHVLSHIIEVSTRVMRSQMRAMKSEEHWEGEIETNLLF